MEKKTPNMSIECSVTNCAYNCRDKHYCSLNTIKVGTHESNPTEVSCTDCQSFKLGSDCSSGACNV